MYRHSLSKRSGSMYICMCVNQTWKQGVMGTTCFWYGDTVSRKVVGLATRRHVRLHVCGCVSHSKCADTAASRIPLPQHQTPDLLHNQCESVRAAAEMQLLTPDTSFSCFTFTTYISSFIIWWCIKYHHQGFFLFFFVLANKALCSACTFFFFFFYELRCQTTAALWSQDFQSFYCNMVLQECECIPHCNAITVALCMDSFPVVFQDVFLFLCVSTHSDLLLFSGPTV